VARVGELAEGLAERRSELALEREAVKLFRLARRIAVHRLALNELPLHLVERRKLVVAGDERPDLGFDPEQTRDEMLEVRREVEQQRRFEPGYERAGIAACVREPLVERRIAFHQRRDEMLVEPDQAFARVQCLERAAEAGCRNGP